MDINQSLLISYGKALVFSLLVAAGVFFANTLTRKTSQKPGMHKWALVAFLLSYIVISMIIVLQRSSIVY